MSTPLRIAHVVEATTGGVARHVLDLVAHLDPAAFTCVLYLSFDRPDSWRDRFDAVRQRGIAIREIPMARVPDARAVSQLAGWARRDAVDLLHLHSAKAGYHGRLAARASGLPVIYTPHAFPFQRTTDWLRPFYRIVERKLARHTTRIVCVSAGERQEALAAGLPPERLVVIPNGLNFDAWPLPTAEERRAARRALGIVDEDIVLGAMARLVSQKGIDLLLEAAEDVMSDYRHARLMIWGDGPQRRLLQGMARRLNLPRVSFLGATRDPRAAFAAMDVFCAPSRWEGGPYAVLEAMACGLPVIASDIQEHADYLLDGEGSLLFESEIPGPLAGALRATLADLDVRLTLGEAARRHVERGFPLDRMVTATETLYRDVLGNPRSIDAVA